MLEAATHTVLELNNQAEEEGNPVSGNTSIYSEVKDNMLVVTALAVWFGQTNVEVRVLFCKEDTVTVKISWINNNWNTDYTFQKRINKLRDFDVSSHVLNPLKKLHNLNGK